MILEKNEPCVAADVRHFSAQKRDMSVSASLSFWGKQEQLSSLFLHTKKASCLLCSLSSLWPQACCATQEEWLVAIAELDKRACDHACVWTSVPSSRTARAAASLIVFRTAPGLSTLHPCHNTNRSLGCRGADTFPHGFERHSDPQEALF